MPDYFRYCACVAVCYRETALVCHEEKTRVRRIRREAIRHIRGDVGNPRKADSPVGNPPYSW
ncbi:MAG: hypothetical protein Q8S52_17175 [Methylobacter sp.]|nr:hypothetical protein [Methylobacter sp.]